MVAFKKEVLVIILRRITNTLSVSSAFTKDELDYVHRLGFAAIVDVRSEDEDDAELIKHKGMAFLHVAVDDLGTPTDMQLQRVMDLVNPLLGLNKKVLVHCENGYGRSPLIAASILVKRGMGVQDALALLKRGHPTYSFSSEQEAFIQNLR